MMQNALLKTAPFALLVCSFMTSASLLAQSTTTGQQIHWTQLTDAQLKLDGKPPLTWAVYQPDKKNKNKTADSILALVGHRYLLLDLKSKQVYIVMLSDLHAQGKDFESDDLARRENLIPTTDWTIRDVGPAELIRLTLGDYGRVLDVLLSHPPDMTIFF